MICNERLQHTEIKPILYILRRNNGAELCCKLCKMYRYCVSWKVLLLSEALIYMD